ncbi:hypothetical protein BH23GEM8_BH23GEM8_22180 [soil metagenome]
MPRFEVEIEGRGTVVLPAFGLADAEHRVEKEIVKRLPEARVSIHSVERPPDSSRIVEELSVTYSLRLRLPVEAADDAEAVPTAFRAVRDALIGTRYERTRWEQVR